MARISFNGETYETKPRESVLECLERCGGSARPSSCRSGLCQSCMMRATSGAVPAEAQAGLKDAWRSQGLFLACICRPEADIEVCEADAEGTESVGVVLDREAVSDDVVRLRVRPQEAFEYRAGQFVNLVRPSDRVARPYSIASTSPNALEFHIRRIAVGQLSGWLCDEVNPGDTLGLRGPSGSCFYTAEPEQPLLLAGTSTGLAPLLGVVRDALERGHRGPISLYHGSARMQGLYLADELRELAKRPNVDVFRHVLEGPVVDDVQVGSLEDSILARDDLGDAKAWVCGAPAFVSGLKRKLFLGGMSLKDISSDAFAMKST